MLFRGLKTRGREGVGGSWIHACANTMQNYPPVWDKYPLFHKSHKSQTSKEHGPPFQQGKTAQVFHRNATLNQIDSTTTRKLELYTISNILQTK